MSSDSVVVLMGDMLFPDLSALPPDAPILMAEDEGLATTMRHHQHKLVLFFASMRRYAEALQASGREVHYRRIGEGPAIPMPERIARFAREHGATAVHTFEPNDASFRDALAESAHTDGIALHLADSPSFLTSKADWMRYRRTAKRLHMADFYRWQRRRLNLLVEPDGSPVGGKWSFDEDNRKPLPKSYEAPPFAHFSADAIVRDVIAEVKSGFATHPGDAETFFWPTSRAEALQALDLFLDSRFDDFGPYEDAISRKFSVLNHSMVSPLINLGLITPQDVVEGAMRRHRERPVPQNSLEGFIRQVIGWREFVKGVDREYEVNHAHRTNALGHTRKLEACWWTGETGLPPLDAVIRGSRHMGWRHHIERLMIVGSAMLMAGVDPDEAYRWFMEMFIDSAEWVMRPNVYGMSQFADGALFATKPYISGSSYVLKMSDWPKGEWCDVWDGLYWGFLERHRERFAQHPRMAMPIAALGKLDPMRKARVLAGAEGWIARVTREA